MEINRRSKSTTILFQSCTSMVKWPKSKVKKLLSQWLTDGYPTTHIKKPRLVHRLVADAFVPNPNKFEMVDHIDSNRQNNHPSNLRWIKNNAENI